MRRRVAVRRRAGDMVSIARCAVARNLGQNGRAARLRVRQALQHKAARAFAHDKARAACIKWDGRTGRIVARVHRLHILEARHRDRDDAVLGAAADHHILISVADRAHRLTDRVVAGRASGYRAEILALETEAHRDISRRHVGDHLGDAQRRHTTGALFVQLRDLLLGNVQTAHARAVDHARAVGVEVAFLEARLIDRLLRRRQCEVAVEVHAARLALVHILGYVKILDLCGQLDLIIGYIKLGDRPNAALAGLERCPKRLHVIANRRDCAHTGDDYSFHQSISFFPHTPCGQRLPRNLAQIMPPSATIT